MIGLEPVAGMLIVILLVVIPIVAISRTFARQTLIQRWRRLFLTWSKAFSSWNPHSSWTLAAGGLGKGLPLLEGAVERRPMVVAPLDLGNESLSLCLRYPLKTMADVKLTVEPETLKHKIKGFFTGEPQVGDAEFDESFWIVSSVCEQAVRDLIPAELCRALVHFRRSRESWICLHVSNSTLIFEERGGPLRPHGYPELLEALSHLADHLERHGTLYDASGDFLMEVVTYGGELPEGARCQICGGPLGRARVECVACKTPHHPDCWEYNGACAIFGCGCTQCRKVDPES